MFIKKFLRPDIYLVSAALVVALSFGTAWALTWNAERDLHETQCQLAVEWLEGSTSNADLFERARTMQSIEPWLAAQDELNSPSAANQLRWSIMDSARYEMNSNPTAPTTDQAVLNSPWYTGRIERGAADLIQHCPEVESLLPAAFPMVFTQEPSE